MLAYSRNSVEIEAQNASLERRATWLARIRREDLVGDATEFYRVEPLPGVLGNTGTVAFIFREQGIFSNYFQGTGELLTRLLGSFLGTRGFSNGEQGIKSKKVKGSWEHAPPPWEGLRVCGDHFISGT